MSKCSNRILVIFVSFLFLGPLPAQEWVRDTRLLVKIQRYNEFGPQTSGSLGSKLFVYTRVDPDQGGSNLFRLEANQEFPVSTGRSVGSRIHDIQVSRDDSRIVFASSGMSHHYPVVIYSVRPDGSQLTPLVSSGLKDEDDCGERFKSVPPYSGSPFCSVPRSPRLSPDGKRILFFNEVREWDEDTKDNLTHRYLSMVPATGGPIVRLVEVPGPLAVWNEDSTSIYYYESSRLRRYDLKTGRFESIVDKLWPVWGPMAVSQGDGFLYFRSKQGFVRLDPETGVVEVVSEERFDTFDLSPDGRRAAGLKEGDVTIVNLEFPSSSRLVIEPGVVDELELGRIPAARKKWAARQRGYAATRRIPFQVLKRNGVKRIRWLDNERLWCVVQEDRSTGPTRGSDPEVRVGIVRLAN